MQVIALNASPRKNWNTATLLAKALEGAASAGAETELVHLYDLDYKGCHSCFACKLLDGPSRGRCAVRDGLTPLLQKLETADAVIFGSPIYYGQVTGELRSCLERFLFQYMVYDAAYTSLRAKPTPAAFIYTMNVNEETLVARNYKPILGMMEAAVGRTLKDEVLSLYATDTCQFNDYAKYGVTAFDPAHKARRRTEQLPIEGRRAFELGAALAGRVTER